MNHWIAGVPLGAEPLVVFKHEPLEVRGQPGQNLSAVYKNMYLLETDRRGDCGVDVLTMILGWERNEDNRNLVRDKLVEAAWKSQNNRAFIFLMENH